MLSSKNFLSHLKIKKSRTRWDFMFLAQKFCRIEQYNSLGRGEIRSAQGHVFCGSAFARYVHVLKENTMISRALRLRKIVFFRFFFRKKRRTRGFPKRSDFEKKCSKKRKNGNVTKKTEKLKNWKRTNFKEGRRARTAKREGSKRSQAGSYTLPNSRSPASGGNYWYIIYNVR